MKTPLDDDLKQTYRVFDRDHERLRETLMSSLPASAGLREHAGVVSSAGRFIRGTIMKSRITKLAAAAVIAVVVIIGLKGFNGTTAWAEVIKAVNNADNIHVVLKITCPDGKVEVEQAWLKNKTMFRQDETDEVTIDDGQSRMRLDFRKNTAQLSDSYSPFEDYMEKGRFEIILLFRGEQTAFKATELADESTRTVRVYQVKYRDMWEGKAWVDAKSNLPLRISAEVAEKYRQRALSIEIIYDYQPIPIEKFSLVIPPGYRELPRGKTRLFSGKVVDEKGNPVKNAEICTSARDLRGRTDERGEFAVRLHPGRQAINEFPMIVRAFEDDDPNRLAWTLLRNPRHELRPLYIPDDGKTKLEQGGEVDIQLVDEKKLIEFIPSDPGNMTFKNQADRYPSEVRDIVLQMGPASVITGRVVDREGQPITEASVWMDRMCISVGENEIDIRNLGHSAKERELLSSLDQEELEEIGDKHFAITNTDGCYKLGNLPDVWYQVRLQVKADGYVGEAREIFQEEGADFSLFAAGITIRGTVVDNHGVPLVGREVEIDVDSGHEGGFEVEEAIIDSEGRFELTGVPAVEGLELQVRTDEKPRDWDRNELTRDRKFIYYRMIEKPIKLEPGKKDYWVEIVLHRPDVTLQFEIRDSEGKLLEGVPVGICSTGFSERVWFTSKLNGRTNKTGICTIDETPRIEPLTVWISSPTTREMHYWHNDREVNMEVKNAMTEFGNKYHPTELTIQLEEGKKKYKIPVVLEAIGEQVMD
jgi:protocatechuate 3,4-dioxygenase beta subunit